MNELELRIQAINTLLSPTTWSMNNDTGTITVSEDGVAPTEEAITAEIMKIKFNAPIIAQLGELDDIINRPKEKKASELNIALDAIEVAVVAEKAALRDSILK